MRRIVSPRPICSKVATNIIDQGRTEVLLLTSDWRGAELGGRNCSPHLQGTCSQYIDLESGPVGNCAGEHRDTSFHKRADQLC